LKFKDFFLLPNLITLTRFFSAIFLFIKFTPLDFYSIYLVLIIALIGLSDSLDGIVARRFNMVSKLGIVLDPFTDRVVFILLLLWLRVIIFDWVFYSILVREVFTLLGSIYVLKTKSTVKVSTKGKIGTVLIFVLICLFALQVDALNNYLIYISAIFVIYYFFVAFEYLYYLMYKK